MFVINSSHICKTMVLITDSRRINLALGQFRVLSTRTIPAAGNGESCLGPVFQPFPN